jgi:hypothetical protein
LLIQPIMMGGLPRGIPLTAGGLPGAEAGAED